jgi:hypothetical protein
MMPTEEREPYVASGRPDMSAGGDRTGWSEPVPHEPPNPSFWPAIMAIAIAAVMWSIMLDWIVVAASLALFAIAWGGWIGDLLRERPAR